MRRGGHLLLVLGCICALASTACERGYYRSQRTTFTSGTSAYVAGGGTITSSRTVLGYPVSGVYVGPDGTAVWDGTPPPGYGVSSDGSGTYLAPGYGSYTICRGAVGCGVSASSTTTTVGIGR